MRKALLIAAVPLLLLVAALAITQAGGGGSKPAGQQAGPAAAAGSAPGAKAGSATPNAAEESVRAFRSIPGDAAVQGRSAATGGTTSGTTASANSASAMPAPAAPQGNYAYVATNAGTQLSQPAVLDRKIVRNDTIDLTVQDVGASLNKVEGIATGAGGLVSGSNVTTEAPSATPAAGEPAPKPRQQAAVTIRVPAQTYDSVVKQLRALALQVRSENGTTAEVTQDYTDLQARLRNLQATEQQYLDLLAKAQSIPDIITVQDRLNQTRLEIEQTQGRIQLLDNLTDMATIAVSLSLPPVEQPKPNVATEPGWATKAWDNAWDGSKDVLRTLGTAAITAGVIAVWLIIPGLLLLLAIRLLWPRRQREARAE